MSGNVKDRTDNREVVGLVFVWLMVAGACLAGFAFTVVVVAFANVWIGGIVGAVTGAGLFQMIRHVIRLTKQPV